MKKRDMGTQGRRDGGKTEMPERREPKLGAGWFAQSAAVAMGLFGNRCMALRALRRVLPGHPARGILVPAPTRPGSVTWRAESLCPGLTRSGLVPYYLARDRGEEKKSKSRNGSRHGAATPIRKGGTGGNGENGAGGFGGFAAARRAGAVAVDGLQGGEVRPVEPALAGREPAAGLRRQAQSSREAHREQARSGLAPVLGRQRVTGVERRPPTDAAGRLLALTAKHA